MRQCITAVIFDWDFTLAYTIDENISTAERMATLFRNNGVQASSATIQRTLQQLNQDIAQGMSPGNVYPQEKQDILDKYKLLLQRLGHADLSPDFLYHLYSSYAHLPHYLFPDVRPTLTRLRDDGYKLGVLSNHSSSARAVIQQHLGDLVAADDIMVSEELGVHKPNPAAFERTAARLGIAPAVCAYVGDNLKVDAIGAVAAGGFAKGFWLDRRHSKLDEALPTAVYRITTLAQLPELLSECASA